jgi:glycosyltransferase involved in cell wall biosynthesis
VTSLLNPAVHLVVPEGIDDPTRPSGGNVYDRRLCQELARSGWSVGELVAADPLAGASGGGLAGVLAGLPDGALVLVDGLVAMGEPRGVLDQAERLRIVVLLHMPFGERDDESRIVEGRVLTAASAVVTTSEWSRRWVLEHYALPPERVHVAEPGVDPADLAPGGETGCDLLCVAAVTADKGHAALLAALASLDDLSWRLTCVGSLDRDRPLAERLQRQAAELGVADRIIWTGALVGARLEKAYAAADVLVLATRAESWGMVVGEALARGLPVIATEVGGLPEALGASPDGLRPGLLVPADDVAAMAGVLRAWLSDDRLRDELRTAARARRTTLGGWPETASEVGRVLAEVAP